MHRSAALITGLVALVLAAAAPAVAPAPSPAPSPAPVTTNAGVPLAAGWHLIEADSFGSGLVRSVRTFGDLHARFYESSYFNRDVNGRVTIPNVVINGEQETYGHFEDVMRFSSDHLTIQARGHADGSISSGELVSVRTLRSFCVESRYRIPNVTGAWPADWQFGATAGGDSSELDIEQPIAQYNTVHSVSMVNHPTVANAQTTIADANFTTAFMTWTNATFDASAWQHTYTTCYDDTAHLVRRYIDGGLIYSAAYQWQASTGGIGPDATTIINLAVGGSWPGNVANPAAFSADLDLYEIDFFGP